MKLAQRALVQHQIRSTDWNNWGFSYIVDTRPGERQMHDNAVLMFDHYLKPLFATGMRVLEIGPDHAATFRRRVSDPTIRWETLELEPGPEITYVAKDEYTFPVDDDTFDIVFSSQVIEHVRRPWVWIRELARVSRLGGRVLTINPVSWPYHEYPVDCWRIYPEGMRALYSEAGLSVELSRWETREIEAPDRWRAFTRHLRRTGYTRSRQTERQGPDSLADRVRLRYGDYRHQEVDARSVARMKPDSLPHGCAIESSVSTRTRWGTSPSRTCWKTHSPATYRMSRSRRSTFRRAGAKISTRGWSSAP